MALKLNVAAAQQDGKEIRSLGMDLPEAYIKVGAIMWTYSAQTQEVGDDTQPCEARFIAMMWPSEEARRDPAETLAAHTYQIINPDMSANLIDQAYAHMKKNGVFCGLSLAEAEDC